MGHRLTKIYTRTGDDGSTGLGDGVRVAKDHPRVEAFGTVDELNSLVGLLVAEGTPEAMHTVLVAIQHRLFDLGGELSMPGKEIIQDGHVTEIEQTLDHWNASLAPLKDFILPGGTRAAAICHVARSVCRRAERRLLSLSRESAVSPTAQRYLNRLSDLLFVLARTLNRAADRPDVLWQPTPKPGSVK